MKQCDTILQLFQVCGCVCVNLVSRSDVFNFLLYLNNNNHSSNNNKILWSEIIRINEWWREITFKWEKRYTYSTYHVCCIATHTAIANISKNNNKKVDVWLSVFQWFLFSFFGVFFFLYMNEWRCFCFLLHSV